VSATQLPRDLRGELTEWGPRGELLEFACALDEADEFAMGSAGKQRQALFLFFAKPWNWHAEYAVWEKNGKPGGPGDEGWDGFLEGLGEL